MITINKYAPIPITENKTSERYAPKGPPRFLISPDKELTEDRLGSRDEYEIRDMKIYRTEPKQKNAKTFFSVPIGRFGCTCFFAMIISCF